MKSPTESETEGGWTEGRGGQNVTPEADWRNASTTQGMLTDTRNCKWQQTVKTSFSVAVSPPVLGICRNVSKHMVVSTLRFLY